jgi:hypothetical protein
VNRRRVLSWNAGNLLPIITLFGLVFYGVLRLAYALFYQPLGVTPEEAGLSYAETIAQSALVLLLLAVGIVALFLIVIVVYVVALVSSFVLVRHQLKKAIDSVVGEGSKPDRAEIQRVAQRAVDANSGLQRQFVLITARLYLLPDLGYWGWLKVTTKQLWSYSRAFLIITSVISFAAITFFLLNEAKTLSLQAPSGSALQPPTFAGVPFLGFTAQAVRITPTELASPLESLDSLRHCLLFLGQSGGQVYLYQYDPKLKDGRTFHIPASSIVITSSSERQCAGAS